MTAAGSPSAITRPASMQTSRLDALHEHVDDVLDPDDRDAAAAHLADRRDQLAGLGVGQPGADLVEQQHAGPVASARASSRRLRCSRPRLSARRLASVDEAAQLEHLDAALVARPGARSPPPAAAPTSTFSKTVMPPNGRGTWWARPTPSRQRAGGAGSGDVRAAQAHAALVGPQRAGEHAQQRRLAGAVRPDDADRLAARPRRSRRRRAPTSAPKRLRIPSAVDERVGPSTPARQRATRCTGSAWPPPGRSGRRGSRRARSRAGTSVPFDPLAADDRRRDDVRHRPLAPCQVARSVSTLERLHRVGDALLVLRVAARLQHRGSDVEQREARAELLVPLLAARRLVAAAEVGADRRSATRCTGRSASSSSAGSRG